MMGHMGGGHMGMPPGQMVGGPAGQQQFGGGGYTLQQQQQHQQRHQQEMMMRAQQIQMQQKTQHMQQQKMLMQQQQMQQHRRGQGGGGVSSEGFSVNGSEATKGEAMGKLTEDQLLILDMEARDKALQKKAKQWSALAGKFERGFWWLLN